jgi:hypothetical protein
MAIQKFNPDGKVTSPSNTTNDVLPLNSSVANLNSGITARNTLTVAAAQTIIFNEKTGSIEFIPSVSPTWPIFIKRGTASSQLAASATVFDDVITPCKPAIQVGIQQNIVSYSIYSGSSQTVYTIER